MASCMKCLNFKEPGNVLNKVFTLGNTHVRWGFKKIKNYGVKFIDGEYVRAGSIIVKQKKFEYHPGLNVGLGGKLTLFALRDGHVLVTTEKFKPKWSNFHTEKYYGNQKGLTFYKTYFHVIPIPQTQTFKLVNQI